MRLIDADVLEREGWKLYINYKQDENTMVYETKSIQEIPTAQPERKMGKWIRDKKTEKEEQLIFNKIWMCSKCGEQQCRPKPSNFCPNCGAKMEVADGK